MNNLAGLHDIEAVKIAPPGTWVLDTLALSSRPVSANVPSPNYPSSLNIIARLNWGYGSSGTLPVPDQYPDFATRIGFLVRGARNCSRWIIGNEPNLPVEWPDGQPIYPNQYADCYKMCRKVIHAQAGHESDEVLIAASGPWNNQLVYTGNPNGDWINYFSDVIAACRNSSGGYDIDGFSLHSYTHAYNISLVTSSARETDQRYSSRHSEFRTYVDYIEAIPSAASYPIYITEANGNGPWEAVGLMPAMLSEVNNFNLNNKPQIRCVIFFRYPNFHDGYNIEGKGDVVKEYLEAAGRNYPSPSALKELGEKAIMDTPSSTPSTSNPAAPVSSLPPRQITDDFKKRVPTINLIGDDFTQPYYRLVKAEYVPDGAKRFGPDHHILVEVLDENGKREMGITIHYWWGSGANNKPTDKKDGPYASDYDMPNDGYSYGVSIQDGDYHSDSVFGMGLGTIAQPDWKIHVDYFLTFQKIFPSASPAPAPAPQPTPTPAQGRLYVSAPAGLFLRMLSNAQSTGIVLAPYAASVEQIGRNAAGDWAQVTYGGLTGWMALQYLSATPPPPGTSVSTPPVPPPTAPIVPVSGALDPLLLEAIMLTEAGGTGFENGRLKIRLEAHLLLGATFGNPSAFTPYFQFNADNFLIAHYRSDAAAPWIAYHDSQGDEWAAFTFACKLDIAAAMRCISMGAGQVMGFNAQRVGYPSPVAMFNAFERSEIAQVLAVVNYCLTDPGLVRAIASRDYTTIARDYNGVGLESTYASLLIANYKKVGGQ